MISFVKMHSLGNDFVIIDSRYLSKFVDFSVEFIKSISHRKFGIGFDQLLVITDSGKADIKMLVYNADGSVAEVCGNGARCVAWFFMDLSGKDNMALETAERILFASRKGTFISINMGNPNFSLERPFGIYEHAELVSIGNPHCVLFEKELGRQLNDVEFSEEGAKICNSFEKGSNVQLVNIIGEHDISIKIFERGVGLTMACGSGAVASAVAAVKKGFCLSPITVHMEAGSLLVEYKDDEVKLSGEVSFVFEGKMYYSPDSKVLGS